MGPTNVPSLTGLRLLVELLESILELGKILDLALQHLNRVVLINWLASVALEVAHLVHPTDDLLLGDSVLFHYSRLLCCHIVESSILWFIYDLDSGYISIVILIVLEFDIII